jgi:CDP-4-dehydro-6-deoxyglucose reductase
MSHRVRIEPSGREFDVEGGDTLLEAALRAGLALGYGCSNGNCGQCRARLLSGSVHRVRHHDFVFGEAEVLAGAILPCSVAPEGDLVIEAGDAETADQIPLQRVTAQLHEVRPLGDDLAAVTLRPPRSQRLRFLAGQRATLSAGGLPPLELGIASCPCEERRVEFHVPRLADAPLGDALLDGVLPRYSPVTLDGPHGDFVLDRDATRPLLFVALGTGFAPIRSLVEHALALEQVPRIHLARVAVPPHGLYLDNLCRTWVDALDDFGYTTHTPPADPGDAGALADALLAAVPDVADAMIHVAGPAPLAEPLATAVEAQAPGATLRLETAGCPA